jgi:hypothetical protein
MRAFPLNCLVMMDPSRRADGVRAYQSWAVINGVPISQESTKLGQDSHIELPNF